MPVTQDTPAPYAPASAIIGLIERHRTKGLPPKVDAEVLQRSQVSESLIPRTLQALQALDLINDDGSLTDVLEGLRLAPEAEYKTRMQEWLRGAYADALQYVDPATDDETQVRDAFRSYKPVGQQPRMVTLFINLFAAAGVGGERSRTSAPRQKNSQPRRVPPARHSPDASGQKRRDTFTDNSLPAPLAGLLASLPVETGWTKDQRDKFLTAFESVLDFCVPINEKGRQNNVSEDEEADD